MTSTMPAQRLTDPTRFGKRPDIELVVAVTSQDEILNEAALAQHTAALTTLDMLRASHKSLDDLAGHLDVGKEQLRRKLYGKARAGVLDLAAWKVGSLALTTAADAPVTDIAPVVLPQLPENPDAIASWVGGIWEGDCIPLMHAMPAASVDLILADLPYGTTRNKWDSLIPVDELWSAYEHLLKPGGCVVLTAAQPFTSTLVMSNLKWFKYEWIWSKTIGSGQLNAKHQPMRTHESVLVFANGKPPYFPQMEEGKPYSATRKATAWEGRGYNGQTDHTVVNTGTRYPKSVQLVPNPRIKGGHPTQKPVTLFEYLIKTYTEPGAVVLDNVIGSGTTAEAAHNLGRQWVGMELDPVHAATARARLKNLATAHGQQAC